MRYCILLIISMALIACTDGTTLYVPAQNPGVKSNDVVADIYRVEPGDTIYAVAWHFDLDYRDLVRVNHLQSPYTLRAGQELSLLKAGKLTRKRQLQAKRYRHIVSQSLRPLPKPRLHHLVSATAAAKDHSRSLFVTTLSFIRPTRNAILHRFNSQNKGLDFIGKKGQPIMTTAPGVVVYAGTGIRGYGKLLIVKHNDDFLSAYAHNDQLLVKEGEKVKARQIIATMGDTASTQVMLHFELRKAGVPVDPLRYFR